jgi:hypothetical protein
MAIDLTQVVAAEMLVARLELPDDVFPVLQRNDDTLGWVDILNLDTRDWDLTEVKNLAVTKPYLRLRILDNDDSQPLETLVLISEAVAYDGWRYKISRENEPFGTARIYTFKLDPLERL